MKHMVAFDCGNSSFRVVLGTYDGSRVTMEVISQTPNEMVQVRGRYYWDILMIFHQLKKGLRAAVKKAGHIDSIGICTWGVDFALYDADGFMLGNPLSYRNTIGERYLEKLSEGQKRDMFFETGILCDKINSVYMLAGLRDMMSHRFAAADKLLMLPDILNYMFTGVMVNEPSELSTTQLMDARTGQVSPDMCRRFGIPESLFGQIGVHGTAIGNLLPEIGEELGIDYAVPVVCVPSHDTAAAVCAIPASEEEFLFVSSGTWSLIGTERKEPIVSEETMAGRLTNEVGAFGRITLLKNNAGMFINQCLKPEYEEDTGSETGWSEFSELGLLHKGGVPLFNVNDSRFFNPRHMAKEIWSCLAKRGVVSGALCWPTVVRSYQISLACSYGQVVSALERLCGKTFGSIYIVGGGSRNLIQNQLVADCLGKTVIVCSKEGTSLGNLAAQIAYFEPEKSVEEIRAVLGASTETRAFRPEADRSSDVDRYQQLDS